MMRGVWVGVLMALSALAQDPEWKRENFAGPLPPGIERGQSGRLELLGILGSRRWRHGAAVLSVAFSPDGKRALSASYDRTLKLWDVESGKEVATWWGHAAWVSSVAFSPDGKRALSGSEDFTLKLWDVESGKPLATWGPCRCGIYSVAFSPDGKRALSGGEDRTLQLWDVESGRELAAWEGHTGAVHSVAFSPDGKRALSGSWDNTLKLWDVESGKELATWKGHADHATSVAFSPDGKRAISGSEDKTVRLWDVESGKELATWKGQTIEQGWSRHVLSVQIQTHAHERQNKAITNFRDTLPPADSDLAIHVFKDPYLRRSARGEGPGMKRNCSTPSSGLGPGRFSRHCRENPGAAKWQTVSAEFRVQIPPTVSAKSPVKPGLGVADVEGWVAPLAAARGGR